VAQESKNLPRVHLNAQFIDSLDLFAIVLCQILNLQSVRVVLWLVDGNFEISRISLVDLKIFVLFPDLVVVAPFLAEDNAVA